MPRAAPIRWADRCAAARRRSWRCMPIRRFPAAAPCKAASQGILSTIAGGIQAAAVANTFLRRPVDAEHAGAFYLARQRERVANLSRTAADFYRAKALQCDRPFWRARMGAVPPGAPRRLRTGLPPPGLRLCLSPGVQFVQTPVLQDDLIGAAPALAHPSCRLRSLIWRGSSSFRSSAGCRRARPQARSSRAGVNSRRTSRETSCTGSGLTKYSCRMRPD
jgi:hypothetical protein